MKLRIDGQAAAGLVFLSIVAGFAFFLGLIVGWAAL